MWLSQILSRFWVMENHKRETAPTVSTPSMTPGPKLKTTGMGWAGRLRSRRLRRALVHLCGIGCNSTLSTRSTFAPGAAGAARRGTNLRGGATMGGTTTSWAVMQRGLKGAVSRFGRPKIATVALDLLQPAPCRAQAGSSRRSGGAPGTHVQACPRDRRGAHGRADQLCPLGWDAGLDCVPAGRAAGCAKHVSGLTSAYCQP